MKLVPHVETRRNDSRKGKLPPLFNEVESRISLRPPNCGSDTAWRAVLGTV